MSDFDFNDLLLQMNDDLNNFIVDNENEQNISENIEIKLKETTCLKDYNDETIIHDINELCSDYIFKPSNPRVSTMTATGCINLNSDDLDFVNKETIKKYVCKDCMGLFKDKHNHKCKKIQKKSSYIIIKSFF